MVTNDKINQYLYIFYAVMAYLDFSFFLFCFFYVFSLCGPSVRCCFLFCFPNSYKHPKFIFNIHWKKLA